MEKTCIRYYSFTNGFMDMLVYVDEEHTQAALECLERGFKGFYENDCYDLCVGDCVEGQLNKMNIPFIIEYPELDEDGDPVEEWEEFVQAEFHSGKYNVVAKHY